MYWITIFGRTGVDLFFVLSGFLITGIILDRKQGFRNFLMSFYAQSAENSSLVLGIGRCVLDNCFFDECHTGIQC